MRESAEQMPRFTQTDRGGKNTAKNARKQSDEHMMIKFLWLSSPTPVLMGLDAILDVYSGACQLLVAAAEHTSVAVNLSCRKYR